jgi:hypothetical protein
MSADLKELVEAAVSQGRVEARRKTEQFLAKHGDRDACGFAWVTVYEKGSTKLGKALIANGFSKSYSGGLQLWDPSQSFTQSISAKEAGAEAFVAVMKNTFPAMQVYAGSRMD